MLMTVNGDLGSGGAYGRACPIDAIDARRSVARSASESPAALHGVPQLQPSRRRHRRVAARGAGRISCPLATGRAADRAWTGAQAAGADLPRPEGAGRLAG